MFLGLNAALTIAGDLLIPNVEHWLFIPVSVFWLFVQPLIILILTFLTLLAWAISDVNLFALFAKKAFSNIAFAYIALQVFCWLCIKSTLEFSVWHFFSNADSVSQDYRDFAVLYFGLLAAIPIYFLMLPWREAPGEE